MTQFILNEWPQVCTSAIYNKRSDELAGTFWSDTADQTGNIILTQYNEWYAFCKNTYNSEFCKHILKCNHSIDTTDSTMEVLYTMGKCHTSTLCRNFIFTKKQKKKKPITNLMTNVLENKCHPQSLTTTRFIMQRQ